MMQSEDITQGSWKFWWEFFTTSFDTSWTEMKSPKRESNVQIIYNVNYP